MFVGLSVGSIRVCWHVLRCGMQLAGVAFSKKFSVDTEGLFSGAQFTDVACCVHCLWQIFEQ